LYFVFFSFLLSISTNEDEYIYLTIITLRSLITTPHGSRTKAEKQHCAFSASGFNYLIRFIEFGHRNDYLQQQVDGCLATLQ